MIKRRRPIPQKRKKPRRGKLTPKQRAVVRRAVYDRCGGQCELKLRDDCLTLLNGGVPLPFKSSTPGPYGHWHMVHKVSEGAGGKTDMENCCGGCWKCHLLGLHVEGGKGKIVPSKVRARPETTEWTDEYYGNRD